VVGRLSPSRVVAPDCVSVREAATLLGVSRDVIYDAVHRGELRAHKIGGRIVIPIASLRTLPRVVEEE
jgi:excisionase family DNA binding protein